MNYQIITDPLVGAIIGYITNDIAIRMLFRPTNPIYILGRRVPFTPGLIPKEKARLAEAVGKTVGGNLLTADTVESALLSDRMTEKITGAVDAFLTKLRESGETVEGAAKKRIDASAFDEKRAEFENRLADILAAKLIAADVGSMASKGVTEYAKKKAPSLLATLVHELVDDRVKLSVQGQIRDAVNEYVEANARDALYGAIRSETEKLLQMPVSDIVAKNEERIPLIKERLLALYRDAIRSGTEKILQSVDLATIVREKIENLDNAEMERLILKIASRELRAIVWLGAALGWLMGFINYWLS
ncbi:MAG: DUF445 domain-containing protein [Christensenellales bacterium]